jgi:hypothetical protein
VVGNLPKSTKNIGKKTVNRMDESVIMVEAGALDHTLSRFKHEVKQFQQTGSLDDDLYQALFDFYLDAGDLPYGVAKARTGDPYEWVSNRLATDLGISPAAHNESAPSDQQDLELNELARLAGLNIAESKPDFLDLDGDDDTKESMKKAAADKKKSDKVQTEDRNLAFHANPKNLFDMPSPSDGQQRNKTAQDIVAAMVKRGSTTDRAALLRAAKAAGWPDADSGRNLAFHMNPKNLFKMPPSSMDETADQTFAEDDMEEGNEFSGELAKAKATGAKEFEVDGKTYPVTEDDMTECGDAGMSADQESSLNVSTNMSSTGDRNVTVSASGEQAEALLAMLKMAGLGSGHTAQSLAQPADPVEISMEEEYANEPDTEVQPVGNILRQGNDLNREKKQYADKPRAGDNPMATMEQVNPLDMLGRKLMQAYNSIKAKK